MSRARIRPLDPVVVDQIAAGEVVERPASVVKELLENALDAGSTRIHVRLEEGGVRRIEVRDDGQGILPEELPLAVQSHATSKLRAPEDLDAIGTLGFRGEALASIAAVARLELTSRPPEREEAARIQVEFGRFVERGGSVVQPAAGPPGTRILVEDLFAELPARRRFLKQPATEAAHAAAWVERLALSHAGVGFRLERDGRTLLDLAPEAGLEERLAAVFGAGIAERMVCIEEEGEGILLEARVGPPESARRDANRVHLFLNGRWVRDARLLRAVREGVREFVETGFYPTLYLALAMPPEQVDVNVHPRKTEVRFRQERFVFGFLLRALHRGLSRSSWATRSVGELGGEAEASAPVSGGDRTRSRDFPFQPPWEGGVREPAPASTPRLDLEEAGSLESAPTPVLSIGRTFLVREVPGGMEILDQHALHERVNLEELRRQVRRGGVVSQPLLVPALVDLAREEVALLQEKAEELRPLGVEIEAFSETSVAVRAVPACLERLQPERLVEDLLEIVREERPARVEALQEEVLHRMACRGAVMAGDRLDAEALQGLLRRGAHLPQDRTCAHGRPVRVFLSLEDLNRAFQRR